MKKLPKKEKKEKTFLYVIVENIPAVDTQQFKEKVCEVLKWTEKKWTARYYGITDVSNAEISLVNRLFLAYKENKTAFFNSTITDYNYQSQLQDLA